MDPSQLAFAATLPATHEYRSNERSAVNRLLPGTSSDDTATESITVGFVTPRATTTQRPFTGTVQEAAGRQPCPSFVASLSSIRLPRFVLVMSGSPAAASPVIVAPFVAEARFFTKWIVMLRDSPGLTCFTLKRANP